MEKVDAEGNGDSTGGKVIDLTELLKRSLAEQSPTTALAAKKAAPAKKTPAKKLLPKLSRAV